MMENYCYSCNMQLCNKCFQAHINIQQHITRNKKELQSIIQNELKLLTQNEGTIEEFGIYHDLYESKITNSEEKKEYIDFYTKLGLKDIDSVKLGLISRKSLEEGKNLQKELKNVGREYQELLSDVEQGVVDTDGMLAIRIIDEERYQYYSLTSCEEVTITDEQREEFLNHLNEVENCLLIENEEETGSTSKIDQIFKIIFILLGIILSSLIISLIIYSILRANTQDDLEDHQFKLKIKAKFYNSRIYEGNILDKNMTLLMERNNYQRKDLEFIKLNISRRREQLALKKEEIISIKSNISKITPNIKSLLQSKILSNKEYSKTLQLQDNTKINNKFSFALIRNMWIILTNSAQPPLEHSHKFLLKYSKLIRYWTAYNYIGGTFIIISGIRLNGISIIWYEVQLIIEYILWDDINIGLHQLIENGELLVVGSFPSTLYYFNMSNCLIIHEKALFPFNYIWLLDYNPSNPSNIEVLVSGEEQPYFMKYNYKTSLISNNITLDFHDRINEVFKASQLPKFIIARSSNIFGYSSETGLELQEYNHNNGLYLYSSHMIELSNNKLGYIAISELIILDLDTLTFVEVFETNTGDNIFYTAFRLSPDRNIFFTMTSSNGDYSIIQFDTRTVIWSGELKYYESRIRAATQVQENIFIYADSNCMLWIIDVQNNLHLLFNDIGKYEKEEFNYYPKLNSYIKTISVIERDRSSTYTIDQI